MQIISLSISLILVSIIVAFSSKKGSDYISWAYHIGDQPLYRVIYLGLILIASLYSFPVALMLVLLYMMINSMIPILSELDETFIFGPPVSECNAYDKASVKRIGTPFYPLHANENADEPPPACVTPHSSPPDQCNL
jgi:hypothetical protein